MHFKILQLQLLRGRLLFAGSNEVFLTKLSGSTSPTSLKQCISDARDTFDQFAVPVPTPPPSEGEEHRQRRLAEHRQGCPGWIVDCTVCCDAQNRIAVANSEKQLILFSVDSDCFFAGIALTYTFR